MFYRRRLPHWIPEGATVFLTWRLAESVPSSDREYSWADHFDRSSLREHDKQPGSGPFFLQDARIATMLVNALRYGESSRHLYQLHAWVVMPNHVHAILQPRVELPKLMRWLKGRTSRLANRILGRTGTRFWQDESFDHWVRSSEELQELIEYVEGNPVKAGLVPVASEWPWSSARFRADDTNRSSAPRLLIENFNSQM